MKQENCIFCKIVEGSIPSATVYEDEDFKAILDISPAAKGHVILLPKKHVANIYEVEDSVASKAYLVTAKLARAIKEELGCDGLNILQNNGEAAGQTVFHLHIHLIPRYKDDSVAIRWKQGNYEGDEANLMAKAIASKVHC